MADQAPSQPGAAHAGERRATENVVFVTTDGFRWQEVFGGPEEALIPADHGTERYWSGPPEQRRKALMPFLWDVMARRGQIFGNRAKGSPFDITNPFKFSGPCYSELLCGYADPRITSNDPTPHPNVTVLEWLHGTPAFRGKVAAFGAWAVIEPIINAGRCGFEVNAGYTPLTGIPLTPRLKLLNDLKAEIPRRWRSEPYDALTHHTAMEYLEARSPRVLYIAYGETDEWAHTGDYAQYLASAHRVDAWVRALWENIQSLAQYRDKTTFLVGTDHGRGTRQEWRDHGADTDGSEQAWLAVMGPDTPALGERTGAPAYTENQIAATLAAMLGEDYATAHPQAGRPIRDVLGG